MTKDKSEIVYMLAGQKLINTPTLLAYKDEPLIRVVTKPSDELGIECYLYHEGKHAEVVRENRMYPGKDFDSER